jgi:hypothetical protein
MMDWIKVDGVGRVALNVFSPGELEAATGLTADMQRGDGGTSTCA